ncbi:hypothetical protein C4552_03200 [Candidatus Parcubacteria bacterium]|nr:MAG: hypothetical protein C4552_03200 [Candidatus Parcubacteria bacterium]
MNGIVYVRVSSQEQTHGTSLENQKRACADYAAAHGIDIARVFVERGESATAANRTELIRALDFCRESKQKIEGFIVWKIDRFARNTTDHYGLRAQLAKYGVRLHSVTEPISDDPIGKMTEAVLAGYAQFENDIRRQRCEGGLRRRIEEGIRPWQPPIGYINSKKRLDRRKTIADEPDPERFFLVQRGLLEYSKGGYTIERLTQTYTDWGLRTRTGKAMRKQLVETMLRDKFYAGVLVDPWTGKEYQGRHEAMISLDDFERIQGIKNGSFKRGAAHLSDNPDFPLRKLIKCTCGVRLTGGWRKGRSRKYAYYNCRNRSCGNCGLNIIREDLEDMFVALLGQIAPKERFLQAFRIILLDRWENQRQTLSKAREFYEQEMKRLEMRKDRLLQMRMNGEISREEFTSNKDSIENQIVGLRISQNESAIDELDAEAVVNFGTRFIADISNNWVAATDIKVKQRIQNVVFPEGLTYDKTAGAFCTAVLSPVFELSQRFTGNESGLVAGPGIAPGPGGYEPPDVLLVHPA